VIGLAAISLAGWVLVVEPVVRRQRGFRAAMETGNTLVTALDQYRLARGRYPERLEELTPAYVAVVPPPPWGLPLWRYRVTSEAGSDFVLLVVEDKGGTASVVYYSADRQWVTSDDGPS
jgi:type II secretory pathway pseudopilin PulG